MSLKKFRHNSNETYLTTELWMLIFKLKFLRFSCPAMQLHPGFSITELRNAEEHPDNFLNINEAEDELREKDIHQSFERMHMMLLAASHSPARSLEQTRNQ